MAKGKQYGEDIKERAYALYAASGNMAEVARTLGVARSCIHRWLKEKPPDELDELRTEKKKEFIEVASDIIRSAMERLAADIEDPEKDIPVNHLTTVIGTLYDKRALARGESTENTSVTFKLPEGIDDYAG